MHKNKFAWNPEAFKKKNETEPGGKLRPYSEITGVCSRCRDQIQWKRKYGKYKPLVEPSKCQRCSKRNVRQAYHNLCTGCAKEHNVCAKCSCKVERIVGRDITEVEAEKKTLEDAIKNSRERDRRALLRAMNKGQTGSSVLTSVNEEGKKVGELFSAESIEEFAKQSRAPKDEDHDSDDEDDEE
ncbi:uncharacterized protein C9orf85 homolog [Papaver somniferum]|uniref:uncharacterized protein C9orf85 homolog n=1 Tax=Papaver somniferum TaxID=3469 RepID=UPI000E6F5FAE|nr:uncharacterized protein C9orf85 homolog [Papaver somniferum]